MNESAIQNWSSRALERQLSTLYYERLLTSRDRPAVKQEATTHIQKLNAHPRDFRDPVMLEFLGSTNAGSTQETNLEQAPIHQLQALLLELELRAKLGRNRQQLRSGCSIRSPYNRGWIVHKRCEDYRWQLPAKVRSR